MSPYALIYEARQHMCKMILDFPRCKEERVIKLLNSAETYPNMSRYQMAEARIMLLDLYISHEIFGNAYDLAKVTLAAYPSAPIKTRMKKLENMMESGQEMIYSCDINMVEPKLCYTASSRRAPVNVDWKEGEPCQLISTH